MLPEISFPRLCLVLREQAASLAALSLLGMLGQFEQKELCTLMFWFHQLCVSVLLPVFTTKFSMDSNGFLTLSTVHSLQSCPHSELTIFHHRWDASPEDTRQFDWLFQC